MGNVKHQNCIVQDCSRGRPYRHGYCELHYNRWKKNGDPLVIGKTGRKPLNDGICLYDDCNVQAKAKGYCSKHYTRLYRSGGISAKLTPRTKKGSKTKNDQGYICLVLPCGRRVREHRYIMEQHLGRELLGHETVHHINGVRDDNRLENLELWSSYQPPGQRVEDKLAWAKEIIELYGK